MTLEGLIKDRNTAFEAVNRHGWMLQGVDETLRRDREIVMSAVKQFGLALQYSNITLRSDPEIVLAAIKKNRMAFVYVDDSLKNDYEFVRRVINENGRVIELLPDKLRNEKQLVLEAAVQKHNWPTCYTDPSLWENRDFVLSELRKDGTALECAADYLKRDREIVLTAVRQHRWALRYADLSLRKDASIVLASEREHGWALDAASESLWKDRDFVLNIVRNNGDAFRFADEPLRNDRSFVLQIVKINGWALKYASDFLKTDDKLSQIAFETYGREFDLGLEEQKTVTPISILSYTDLIKDVSKRIIVGWSGGKDCCLALHRILREESQSRLVYILNCCSKQSGNISFHEIDPNLLRSQIRLLNVPYLEKATTPDGYQNEYVESLKSLVIPWGLDALVLGNIYVNEHRKWGDHVCEDTGIEHIEPLWNENTSTLANEVLSSSIESYIICANANLIDKFWVGKRLDRKFLEYVRERGIDPCGEFGEFHAFVTSCPLFNAKIQFMDTEVIRRGDYWVLNVKSYKVS